MTSVHDPLDPAAVYPALPESQSTLPPAADFRTRIYDYYARSRHEALAPADVRGLESRGPYLRRLIREHFPAPRDAIILDLGCGHGTLVHFARQAGYTNVTGVDRSAEQVAEARRLGIAGVELGDLMTPLRESPAASRDAIVTFDVIEHLTREELLPLVDEVHRVLRPGGRWLIHTPNAESPLFGRIRYGDFTHEQAFTRTSIGQVLFSSGFRVVNCYEDTPVVHGMASAARFVVWRAMRALLRVYLAAETGRLREPAIFTQNFLTIASK